MNGSVRGYVVTGEWPVPEATVTIVAGPGRSSRWADMAPVTDVDGSFFIDDLPAGTWMLRTFATDGRTAESAVDIWDDSLSEVTMDLAGDPWPGRPESISAPITVSPPTGRILGRVVDAGSRLPIDRARVVIVAKADAGDGPFAEDAYSDSDGRFAIGAMTPGVWVLRIHLDDGVAEVPVDVPAIEHATVLVAMVRPPVPVRRKPPARRPTGNA